MSAREELEKQVEACRASGDYVLVAGKIVQQLEDGAWAAEILKEGAEWAATAEEVLAFANCAVEILKNQALGAYFMERARRICRPADEWTDVSFAAVEGCEKVGDCISLAEVVLRVTDDPEQVRSILEAARGLCSDGADYQRLARAFRDLLNDRATALALAGEAEERLEKGADLTALAEFCVRELHDHATAVRLFRSGAKGYESGEDLVHLAERVSVLINDRTFCLEIYDKAAHRLTRHAGLMKLADSVLTVTGETGFADRCFRQAAEAAEGVEQLLASAVALARKTDNLPAASRFLRRAEVQASTVDAFEAVARTILELADDSGWQTAVLKQLEKRKQFRGRYIGYMKQERECATGESFIKLGRKVYRETGDREYCRRLYEKARKRTVFFTEYLALADGIFQHVGDIVWLTDLYEYMLIRWNDLVSVNAVVAQMAMYLPDGRERAYRLYEAKEKECEGPECFIRLAVSVLVLLGDRERCRELFSAAEQAASTQAQLMSLAYSIEEKLQDQPWVEALYGRAMDQCRTGLEFVVLVKAVAGSRLCSAGLLCHLHERAESLLQIPDDLLLLAESIAVCCQDAAWSSRIYRKAVQVKGGHEMRFIAAESILRTLGDRDLASTVRAL